MNPRPIRPEEIETIRVALERAPTGPESKLLASKLEHLVVQDGCKCGCDSVDFEMGGSISPQFPVADGMGKTPRGGGVGILVWGREDAVTGLEIYPLDAPDDDIKLPVPGTIVPYPFNYFPGSGIIGMAPDPSM